MCPSRLVASKNVLLELVDFRALADDWMMRAGAVAMRTTVVAARSISNRDDAALFRRL